MSSPKEEISNQEFIARLTGQVREFLSFLDSDGADKFLQELTSVIETNHSWMRELNSLQGALLLRINETDDYEELGAIHAGLNNIEMDRFLNLPSVTALHKNCTDYRDALAARVMAIVAAEMAAKGSHMPDLPCALVSMGSDGRMEQTLITDQDYLIVYGDGGGEEADDWFKCFSELLVERLVEVGFKKCTGDIMPSNPTWRGSMSQWRRKLHAIVMYEYENYAKNLMDLIVLSDARFVAGDSQLASELVSLIRELEKEYFYVLWGMAKAATNMRIALGFLKRIWTEGAGEHRGEFNLKLLAWAPLVMNVRIIAINQGIPATGTLDRIETLRKKGSFSEGMAAGLKDSYHVLTRYRILLQIKVIKGIQKDSYYLNPYQLPTNEREQIRQALLKIEDLQKVIHTNFRIV
jgi:signal-transduction protein with cAMP-binding, CBS, and nucleotidyltransferase domain